MRRLFNFLDRVYPAMLVICGVFLLYQRQHTPTLILVLDGVVLTIMGVMQKGGNEQ